MNDPGPSKGERSGVGVEEAGEEADVGADVLEEGDGVEGGLGVGLGGFEDWRVDAEAVGGAAGALNPYAGDGGHPFGAAVRNYGMGSGPHLH